MNKQKAVTVTITPGTIATGIFIIFIFALAYTLRDLLLVVLTAVVLASAIEPATLRLIRWGLPRVLAVVLIYLVTIATLLTAFYFFVPQLVREATSFLSTLPTYLKTLQLVPGDVLQGGGGTASFTDQLLQFQNVLKTSASGVLSTASSIFGNVISFVLILVLSFYFAVQERGIDDFLRIVTPMRRHEYILDLWKRAQRKIGRWLQGQLLMSLIVGVLLYIGLALMGVRYALLLAIAAAVLELIPVFGSIIAAIPAVAIAFIDAGTIQALWVIVLYVVVNQIESNIIYPLVVQKVVGVPPLVVILAIIAGYQLAGFLGILIAVPIAAAIQEWVSDVQRGKQQLAYPAEDGTVT